MPKRKLSGQEPPPPLHAVTPDHRTPPPRVTDAQHYGCNLCSAPGYSVLDSMVVCRTCFVSLMAGRGAR